MIVKVSVGDRYPVRLPRDIQKPIVGIGVVSLDT